MKTLKMDRGDCVLVVVDIQDKFVQAINDLPKIIENTIKIIQAFQIMGVPIIVTEQYPKGLGKSVSKIQKELKKYDPIEKITFDCYANKEFVKKISRFKNIILAGIEAHVCITQTALGALEQGFNVYLVKDAISSRKESDKKIAISRLKQEGAKVVSTEMVIFELLGKAGTEEFKKIQKIIK
ncbi:MAG: hydrolase [Nanoarchaeota archaeon]|nr:hydrolase [Nanoarchaeota archaeon]MBU1704337.1 hydrolase [Nanoarchaeota archaeon]